MKRPIKNNIDLSNFDEYPRDRDEPPGKLHLNFTHFIQTLISLFFFSYLQMKFPVGMHISKLIHFDSISLLYVLDLIILNFI